MVLAAVSLRAPLINTGLTIDDACSVYVIEAANWADMVERIRTIEMSPPLYFLLLKNVTALFGLTTPVLAVTSLILSVITVPLTFVLGRLACLSTTSPPHTSERQATKIGLCSAFFATTSILAIIYSHEARTYALAGLLMTLTLILFLPFFDGKNSKVRQAGLFAATALLGYTHYTAVAYIGIMTVVAMIYRKRGASRSAQAIPPMVAGLATLIPWFPILKYHSSVGTPWADPTPLSRFLTVMASNVSAVSPLPVVASYLLITLATPMIIGLYIVLKPGHFLAKMKELMLSPKLLTLALLFIYSTCIFGFITPYIFGYVRYMYPIAGTGWVLLAFALVKMAAMLDRSSVLKNWSKQSKVALVAAIATGALAWSAFEVRAIAAQDRSGLRRLAAEIAANKFGQAAYLTTPDFVGIILVYYLKYECGIKADKLPVLLGFADPDSGRLPPRHQGRAGWWQDPQLIEKYEKHVRDIGQTGAQELVLVRDTYTPTSRLEPTREKTDLLEGMLKTKLVQEGPTETYAGRASSYLVTRFAFPNAAKDREKALK
ncbi:MAG: hypothetical protein JST01_29625 [Cyanobacteria bacterium SZAS TMP-1]|nr:hypothetical protein [Cyanobacteria bacterium SZAS TMP-1]